MTLTLLTTVCSDNLLMISSGKRTLVLPRAQGPSLVHHRSIQQHSDLLKEFLYRLMKTFKTIKIFLWVGSASQKCEILLQFLQYNTMICFFSYFTFILTIYGRNGKMGTGVLIRVDKAMASFSQRGG